MRSMLIRILNLTLTENNHRLQASVVVLLSAAEDSQTGAVPTCSMGFKVKEKHGKAEVWGRRMSPKGPKLDEVAFDQSIPLPDRVPIGDQIVGAVGGHIPLGQVDGAHRGSVGFDHQNIINLHSRFETVLLLGCQEVVGHLV